MKKLSIALVTVLSLGLSACKDPKNLTELRAKMQEEFGVDVVLNSHDGDGCLHNQMFRIYRQYKEMGKEERRVLAEGIQADYKKIVMEPTSQSMLITGEATYLTYYRRVCGNSCYNRAVATKIISDAGRLSVEGEEPYTKLDKTDVLTITAQTKRNESLRRYYWTRSVEAYDEIESAADENFIRARQRGTVWLDEEVARPETTCGQQIDLRNLLK